VRGRFERPWQDGRRMFREFWRPRMRDSAVFVLTGLVASEHPNLCSSVIDLGWREAVEMKIATAGVAQGEGKADEREQTGGCNAEGQDKRKG
jgi:hypothetical protein